MPKIECINCAERRSCKGSFVSWIFFTIGLIATISIRLVIVLMNWDPVFGKVSWYVGIIGFTLFFSYTFAVHQARSKIIRERQLVDKLLGQKQLTKDESELLAMMLCSLTSRKERINYFLIFFLSAISLLIAVYFDFIK